MRKENHINVLNKSAYLGKLAQDLLHLSSQQVSNIYVQYGLTIPVEVSSCLDLLSRHPIITLTDLATALSIPHQLAAQRVHKLMALNLISKHPDTHDKRRSLLRLTETGSQQANTLRQCMRDMAQVYEQLYQEIGCHLPSKLQQAIDALKSKNLSQRVEATITGVKHE